ncbi:hypothetical protein EW146_g1412 [Bondarzewia mesenterica]|uniref:dolichol kinase n=1 Tax=Bondarzewia mesenterica TaxID=1095465 RepID=A0A4S4M3X9_9AGAM|nr:hypothetical protein EW146_g1412 [Bondarzewia mesenterica]
MPANRTGPSTPAGRVHLADRDISVTTKCIRVTVESKLTAVSRTSQSSTNVYRFLYHAHTWHLNLVVIPGSLLGHCPSCAISNLPRSKSSPSPPPPSKLAPARVDPPRKGTSGTRVGRRRIGSFGTATTINPSPTLDWSTSYQAGSSSSASGASTDDENSDDQTVVDQRNLYQEQWTSVQDVLNKASALTRRPPSPSQHASSSDGSKGSGKNVSGRRSFTRSRSPAPHSISLNGRTAPPRTPSPTAFFRQRRVPVSAVRYVLPGTLTLTFRFPLSSKTCQFAIDAKYAAECSLLIFALGIVAWKLSIIEPNNSSNVWLSIELFLVIIASFIYTFCTHFSISELSASTKSQTASSHNHHRTASSRYNDSRDLRRASSHSLAPSKQSFGFVWMTVPKNYRNSSDDGILSGLILGPLIASSLLYTSIKSSSPSSPKAIPLPSNWYIEPPRSLSNLGIAFTPVQALVLSRRNAVSLATLCSTIILTHVCASAWFEAHHRRRTNAVEGERASVPRSEARKSSLYILFTFTVCLGLLGLRFLFEQLHVGIWQNVTYWEIVCSSVFFQFSLYIAIRLAHQGFTLGELGLVVFGATGLFMELVNLTIARIWPVTTPYVKTYRLATPLLIYQIALIPGSLLTGFLLSPLLVLSRQIAQRPVRRLRFPHEKQAQRRALAAGFYLGTTLIVGGLIGMWTRWCLENRDPWLWVIYWLVDGRKKWTRPALLVYWGLLGSLSVAGWNRQLARSHRYRPRNGMTGIHESLLSASGAQNGAASPGSEPSRPPTPPSSASAMGADVPERDNAAAAGIPKRE